MENLIQQRLKYWYIPLIVGLLFIALGIWVFASPAETFIALAIFFSIGFMISGAMEIFHSLSNRKILKNWGWYLAIGILTFILGFHLLVRPGLSALMLSFYIGFWVMFRSIMSIATSIELKDEGEKNWGWILALGILGVIFSFILLLNPIITGITVAFWIGFGLVTSGFLYIMLSFSFKRVKNYLKDIEGLQAKD